MTSNSAASRQALLEQFDREQRIEVIYPEARKDIMPGIVRFVRPAPGMNEVLYSRLPPGQEDSLIQEQIDQLSPLGQPFEWVVYEHDQPAGLLDRLDAHGFGMTEPELLLFLPLHDLPSVLKTPPAADIRRITTRQGLEDVIWVMQQVYDGSFAWMRGRLGGHLQLPGYLSLYAAYVDDEPVATGWTYYDPGGGPVQFAGLWGGATVDAYRGRGLYTALLAVRVREAAARGSAYAYVNAGEMSAPILTKYGFELLAWQRSCPYVG